MSGSSGGGFAPPTPTVWDWIVDRAQEKSTWAGLATIIGLVVHTQLSPGTVDALVQAGIALAGLAAVVMKDKGI